MDAALRNQPLRGTRRETGGRLQHHWQTAVTPPTDPTRRLWRLTVGPGTVNDKLACMTYLREGDPRGWVMPADHPSIATARLVYGDNFKLVDRLLTERREPPFQWVQSPSEDGAELGDFERVADSERLPLYVFRTAAQWKLDLYRASVFLTAEPRHFSRVEDLNHFPVATRNVRFRIGVAPRFPSRTTGTTAGGNKEIARLYLTRNPRSRCPLSSDRLYVQQRCFWSLWTANAEPQPFGGFSPFAYSTAFPTNPLSAAFAEGVNAAIDTVLAAIGSSFEQASTVEFWTAA